MRDSMPYLISLNIGGATIVEYTGTEGTIEGTHITYPANEMPQYSFYNQQTGEENTMLSSVVLPENLITIGIAAFSYCYELNFVVIPHSVTTIGYAAFSFCSALTDVVIPNSVTTIGDISFFSCSGLTSVVIPNSVTTIGYAAFSFCSSLTAVVISDSVTTIEEATFAYCAELTAVVIPPLVTTIGTMAFNGCLGLTSVVIPPSVTTIGNNAFSFCSNLTSVVIPNSVTTIGDNAFSFCSGLTAVVIPHSVTTIGDSAFVHCNMIKKLTLGRALTTIGKSAFAQSPLDTITSLAIVPPSLSNGNNVFKDGTMGVQNPAIPVYVPCGYENDYHIATGWNYFTNIKDTVPLSIITVASDNENMGTVAITQPNICTNNDATIEATGNIGYCFSRWNDGDTNNPRIITVTQDTGFIALFEITYTVTLNTNDDARGTITGDGIYRKDSTATISATPAATNYQFNRWNDGVTTNPRTITVTQDTTFTAIFDVLYTVTLNTNDGARGTVTGDGIYRKDSNATISATPAATNYQFNRWNDGVTDNPRTITVTRDTTFTAIFDILYTVTLNTNDNARGTVTGDGI
jgi:hypothetical protein